MRESKFANHEGKSITFNDGSGYSFNPLPTYAYSVNPNVIGSKISGFTNADTVTYPVEIGVRSQRAEDVGNKLDQLLSLFKSDISANSYGELTVNGYSLDCYITAMTPTQNLNLLKSATFTVFTDRPVWYKDLQTYQFTPDSSIIVNSPTGETLKSVTYPHGYPHGYPNPYSKKRVINPLYTPAHFKITVFGPCTPSITIGSHVYAVNAEIGVGEMLTIDSRSKTITKRAADGTISNLFDKRSRESNVFEPIQPGENQVAWQGINKFFLTLVDERLVPPWSF